MSGVDRRQQISGFMRRFGKTPLGARVEACWLDTCSGHHGQHCVVGNEEEVLERLDGRCRDASILEHAFWVLICCVRLVGGLVLWGYLLCRRPSAGS